MTGHAEFLRQLRTIAGRSQHRLDLPSTSPRLKVTPATRPIIGDTDLSEGGK